ncbi:SDR family NAD(P)-dependent oxidoreductase [Arhodomonas aquaeolei]|uniref:SDR family NAD(P)-dependent oxidoreductase n=1 Tax=Arhodomonas aquaeolei TaxID=2369 RepID=UPI0003671BF9|nr:SDR family NAD(P)-dependent oxidoreductase [Arhodomonas aquaeolei]
MGRGSALVVGVGPGLGAALVQRFAAGGLNVAMIARGAERLADIAAGMDADEGQVLPYPCDATDEAQVAAVFDAADAELGPVEAVVYNAGTFEPGGIRDISVATFERCWRVGCLGGFIVAREAARHMAPRGRGSLLFTGATAAWRGGAGFATLAVPKFGIRALSQSLARELGPEGVHVAHVVIDGRIGPPDGVADNDRLEPAAIAESYWQLHCQPPNAWTQELDLRPATERF